MKRDLKLMLVAATLLVGPNFNALADWWDWSENLYKLGTTPRPVPLPTPGSSLNCLLPENNGDYIAVWDDTNNLAIVEHRDRAGNQTWQRSFPVTTNGESTRVVLTSGTRTLWCSSKRWVFINNADGSTVKTDVWNVPDLDPCKAVIQNDILYVINGDTAAAFDKDMNPLGTVLATPPGGFWRGYETAWLLDHKNRTNQTIRAGTMAPGLQILNPLVEIPLAAPQTGGYTEQRVLTADANSMFVASSIFWTDSASHFFTCFDRDGNVAFQNRMSINLFLTGSAVLTNGVLLSATRLEGPDRRHYLIWVNSYGVPHYRVRIGMGPSQSYLILNCSPPRVLHIVSDSQLELYEVVRANWSDVHTVLFMNDVELDVRLPGVQAPIASTNYFWITPTRPNNTPKS